MTNSVVLTEEMIIAAYDQFEASGFTAYDFEAIAFAYGEDIDLINSYAVLLSHVLAEHFIELAQAPKDLSDKAIEIYSMVGDMEIACDAVEYEYMQNLGVDPNAIPLRAVIQLVGLARFCNKWETAEITMLKVTSELQDKEIARLKEETALLKAENALLNLQLEIQQRKDKEYFLSQGCSEFVAKMKTAMLYVDGRKGDDGLELV